MQAFSGGFESVESKVNAWTDVGNTFRAGLVATQGLAPDPDWKNLDQFLAFASFLPDSATPSISSRSIESWNASGNRTNYKWSNKLSFGSPIAGQSFYGVLIYEDTGLSSTSPIWFYDDKGAGLPGSTAGGLVSYGIDGPGNVAGSLRAVTGSASPLAGATLDFNEAVSAWTQPTADFRLRLVIDAGTSSPNPDWTTLQEMIDAGVQFASGVSDVVVAAGARGSGYEVVNTTGNAFEFFANPGAIYTFPSVPGGQTVIAVLLFRDTGAAITSRVWHWDGAFAPAAMTGGDFLYGNGTTEVFTRVNHPAT